MKKGERERWGERDGERERERRVSASDLNVDNGRKTVDK